MPLDRYKGPLDAIDVLSLPCKEDPSCNDIAMTSEEDSPDVPKIWLSVGVIVAADGSAYMEYGKTKVMVGVYGPSEMRQDGQLVVTFKFAPFSCRLRRQNQPDAEERRFGQLLVSALEPAINLASIQRGRYEVHVLVIENWGGALAASVTCAGLALINAGAQLYDVVVAYSPMPPASTRGQGEGEEENRFCLAVLPNLRQVSLIVAGGEEWPTLEVAKEVIDAATLQCTDLGATVKSFLRSKAAPDR